MDGLNDFLHAWGPLAVFAVVLAEQLGAPLPTLPLLLLAGTLAGNAGRLGGQEALAAAAGSLLGAWVWFLLGRRYGNRVLGLLCKVSLSPDVCVRQTEVAFERRGPVALVIARFVPGLAMLAPPVAGGVGMRNATFLAWQGLASTLYAVAGIGGGVLFYEQFSAALGWFARHLGWSVGVVLAVVSIMVIWRYFKRISGRKIRRLTPQQVAHALASGDPPLVLDARSQLSRMSDPRSVPGALPLDLEDVAAIAALPSGRSLITYCACPNDASALELARRIQRAGRPQVAVLQGGLDGWSAWQGD
ncbi:MAG: VTT domain-containing protein [Rhodocyclaceae bacterium]|nr:VTT domain-containing protein [Rhodocyclaceae bacterium]MBX3670412.1 VTT domain-containing protein [Rhodocyclaceae bacterium]